MSRVAGQHFPKCAVCGDLWPCRHEQSARAADRLSFIANNTCGHCGLIVDPGQKRVEIGGRVFHGRKGPCRTAAKRQAQAAEHHA